jgi:hypothetical protein
MEGNKLSLCMVQWWTFNETGSMEGSEFLDQPSESPRIIVYIKIQALRGAVRRNFDLLSDRQKECYAC